MTVFVRLLLTGLAFVAATTAAVAHHAFAAEYDINKPVTVKGLVTRVEWTNPHARFYVDGVDEKGTKLTWNFELASINSLVRHGWTRTSLKPGEQVTVKAYMARESADPGKANASEVTLADGRHLFAASSANDAQ
jgi:hypothetical protein